jgi:hypothetical protein
VRLGGIACERGEPGSGGIEAAMRPGKAGSRAGWRIGAWLGPGESDWSVAPTPA